MLSHNGMIQYTCKRKVAKVYLWNVIVTKHIALTISDIAISIEMIMFTGW